MQKEGSDRPSTGITGLAYHCILDRVALSATQEHLDGDKTEDRL